MDDNKMCLEKQPLSQELLKKMNAYWRTANYLSAVSSIFWTIRPRKIIIKYRKQWKISRKEPILMKKSADKLAIAYVIILSLIPVLALPNLIFQSHVLDAIPYDASALTTELGFFLSNLPAIIYIMVLYILGILNIWKSFSSYEEGDSTAHINRMLKHKYGLDSVLL